MFGIPKPGQIDYSRTLALDLASVKPSVSGPKRPQDRIELPSLKNKFTELFSKPVAESGFGKSVETLGQRITVGDGVDVASGDVIIAAITSCTNTSNPSVLIAAGLLAKKAVEKGLRVNKKVKTSLAPGSRVVTDYLQKAGLLSFLEQLGFSVAAYGCTTCIGNSGPLDEGIEETIVRKDLVCAAVLSGNRNFEARIHPNIRANFLMSPPLVVAFAIAGTVLWNPEFDALGTGKDGSTVYLRDVWPDDSEITAAMKYATDPRTFRRLYADPVKDHALWNSMHAVKDEVYPWPASTYIAEPPFFKGFSMTAQRKGDISGARALAIFRDSLTTDHISPAGSIKETSPAGKYLIEHGVTKSDFQSYGTRRGNHEVMIRGTFGNVRIRNLMLPPRGDGSREEGGVTLFRPSGERMSIYDAAMKYVAQGTPTLVFGGEEYGAGSSRDWAAKGTLLLGVRAVIAKSFERIHRSNLVGMGVLPLQFKAGESVQSAGISGDEEFAILGLTTLKPQQDVTLVIRRGNGTRQELKLLSRIDTPIEVDYYLHGGILPYVLRELMSKQA
jgi:aconitate hydratase